MKSVKCNACHQSMPDFGHATCFTCVASHEASRSSARASEAYRRGLAARGARQRETAAASVSARAGSPRRLPTARELVEDGLDVVERGERRTKGEQVIRHTELLG